jgi:hypothetical protein
MGPWLFTMFTGHNWILSWATYVQSTVWHFFPNIQFNIVLHICMSYRWPHPYRLLSKISYAFRMFPTACYMSSQLHHYWFNCLNHMIYKVQLIIFRSWLRWLVAGLLTQRSQFDPRPVHVVFVVDKVTLQHFSFEHLSTSLSVSSHQYFTLTFHLSTTVLYNHSTDSIIKSDISFSIIMQLHILSYFISLESRYHPQHKHCSTYVLSTEWQTKVFFNT